MSNASKGDWRTRARSPAEKIREARSKEIKKKRQSSSSRHEYAQTPELARHFRRSERRVRGGWVCVCECVPILSPPMPMPMPPPPPPPPLLLLFNFLQMRFFPLPRTCIPINSIHIAAQRTLTSVFPRCFLSLSQLAARSSPLAALARLYLALFASVAFCIRIKHTRNPIIHVSLLAFSASTFYSFSFRCFSRAAAAAAVICASLLNQKQFGRRAERDAKSTHMKHKQPFERT